MYKANKRRRRSSKLWLVAGIVAFILIVLGVGYLRNWYSDNLRPVSNSQTIVYFTVSVGDSRDKIAESLKTSGLIRSSAAFKSYIRSNEIQNLQAGTYEFSPSMSVQEIARKLSRGEVAKNLLTILPAKRLDQVKDAFLKAGYSTDQVEAAFRSSNYVGHPALVSLPAGATLEGYLYPDSFQKEMTTPPETIITESLDEMQKRFSQEIIDGFASHGLTPYQGITLASIVLQETDNPAYQPTVAQVFLTRLAKNMPLGSDVTAFYASDIAHQARSVSINSPYNTRLHPGLTPGPIGNVTADAMKAVAHPANTDYLYFVAGDDDKIHFTHTQAEHEAAAQQFCQKKCSL